ncbi:hypothetical protein J7K70_02295 [bacterium]|nr:hypothetical protein [bacterium]
MKSSKYFRKRAWQEFLKQNPSQDELPYVMKEMKPLRIAAKREIIKKR